MILIAILLVLHGLLNLVAVMMGALGYVRRGLPRDAVGVMLTAGVAAIAEIAFGLTLVM